MSWSWKLWLAGCSGEALSDYFVIRSGQSVLWAEDEDGGVVGSCLAAAGRCGGQVAVETAR